MAGEDEPPTIGEQLALDSIRARMFGTDSGVARIGRYEVGPSLGKGGMAEVFEAFDPELQRHLALKVVAVPGRKRRTKRIMREAQAQAQLSHPNVVAIYDVGVADEDVFIAMELVTGETLEAWLKRPRSWREILDKFTAAARGLIAAHEAGLVHRDFKPGNVLLTPEGVAKVADFGLAVQSNETGSFSTNPAAAELDRRLTQTGVAMGTPLYMAPEQHRAERLDAKADQYAFCAALFGALIDDVPFKASSITGLAKEKEQGPPDPPTGLDVPRHILAAVRRGMATDPAQRWPSVRALVSRLEAHPRRRLWWALPVVAGAGLLTWAFWDRQDCDAQARLHDAWGEAAQARLRAAIAGEDEAGWRHLRGTLDAWAESWADAFETACGDDRPRPDPRLECLHARLRRFGALTSAFERTGAAALERVDNPRSRLPDPAGCLDPGASENAVAPDPAWAEIDARLGEASAAISAGDLERAVEIDEDALARARAAGFTRLEAEAVFDLGIIEADRENFDTARRFLERAYFLADELGEHQLAAEVSSRLVSALADAGTPSDDAARWGQVALSHLEHVDDPDTVGAVFHSLSAMEQQRGNFREGAELSAKAVAAFAQAHGERSPAVAVALNSQGLALVSAGDVPEALELLERAAAIYEETIGPRALRRANVVLNLGLCQYRLGRFADAAATFEESYRIASVQTPPVRSIMGRALSNRGLCLLELGDIEGALEAFKAAQEHIAASLGESHPLIATVEMNIALAHHMNDDFEQALPAYERARTAQIEQLGSDHPGTAQTEHNIGVTLNALEQWERAAEHLRVAKEKFSASLGPHSEMAGLATAELARSLVGMGQPEEGLATADLAREILAEASGPVNRWIFFAILYRGTALRELGRKKEAQAAFDEAEQLLDKLPAPEPNLRDDLALERGR